MVEKAELLYKIEEAIAQSRMRYEKDSDDSYLSIVRAEELETLQRFYGRLKSGEGAENLLAELRRGLPELEAEREKEAERPSFDWYDEHYHYKLLDGQCGAYRIMMELLEGGEQSTS